LRTYRRIPCFQTKPEVAEGEIMTVAAAAAALNVAPSTLHRWLNDGLVAGEPVTPGAPWRIRMTDELKAKFTQAAGDGFITMQEATRALGVTRQTVLQRVKRGEIEAAHVTKGGKRGLRIKVIERQTTFFSHL
jgi:excisionase family DNA binding protein